MLVWLAGVAGTVLRVLPLALAIALVVVGVGMVYVPAAFVVSGFIIFAAWFRWVRRDNGTV